MKRTHTNPHISSFILKRNGYFPNNVLPVLIYRNAVELPKLKNSAASIAQKLFLSNDWGNTWRNGIYDFHHYHSNTHECMIICSGTANLVLGGPKGKRVKVERGDTILLPAGVGHRCTKKTDNFMCVGGYPQAKDYDTCLGKQDEYKDAYDRIKKIPIPKRDPIFGNQGFLHAYWKKK
ncbi:MAG TPA: cupin domain-containing protein [Bacteroidia bacterium]|jgi:uncharacterized protein YjlB|nr:cupin domain-containing protein [Bacteroidia bacterium]